MLLALTSCKGSTAATPGDEVPWLSRTGRTASGAAAAAADDGAATLTWRVCVRARGKARRYIAQRAATPGPGRAERWTRVRRTRRTYRLANPARREDTTSRSTGFRGTIGVSVKRTFG